MRSTHDSHGNQTWTRYGSLLAVCAVAAGLGGCMVVPARPVVYGPSPTPSYPSQPAPAPRAEYDANVIMVEPPAPQYEAVGYPPAQGYIWIGGFWNWHGGRHVWVPGRWEMGRGGHNWRPHQWVRFGAGWRLSPGHWYQPSRHDNRSPYDRHRR